MKTPTVLATEETERLLNAIKHPAGPRSMSAISFRNYLLALFMLDAGLRVSEAIQLRRWMISHEGHSRQTLTILCEIAKNHRQRTIPLSEQLQTEITYMINYFWLNNLESRLDFVFHCGFGSKHITARRIQQIIKQAGMNTLGKAVWPHVLRHTFATRLMRVTSTRVVQELLGHKNLTSTQVYTHPNSQDLLKAIKGIEAN